MQTFLPVRTYNESAYYLDPKRLNNQIVECLQILLALNNPRYGWRKHPAVKMWKGNEQGLILYARYCCDRFQRTRQKDHKCAKLFKDLEKVTQHMYPIYPEWYNDTFCFSHAANLVRKFPEHYQKYFPDIPKDNDIPYIWPVQEKIPVNYKLNLDINKAINDYFKISTQLEL